MSNKPEHVERGGEVRADTPDKWSEDDTARQEHGLPEKKVDRGREEQPAQSQTREQSPAKGTDTLATTEADVIEREKGKRTTM
jgi:hypothetical protein